MIIGGMDGDVMAEYREDVFEPLMRREGAGIACFMGRLPNGVEAMLLAEYTVSEEEAPAAFSELSWMRAGYALVMQRAARKAVSDHWGGG